MPDTSPTFLFSVDLEDVRTMIPDGERYREGVPASVERFLELLARRQMRATFFTVGNVARRYPEMVRRIAAAGHELACHSSDHVPLDQLDRDALRRDLERNREDLVRAGATSVCGFRAPIFSLTSQTAWAYEVLAQLGFTYSSSVLPHRGVLYGWHGFGSEAIRTESGVWELPITVATIAGRTIPFAGGVYFRVLPWLLVRRLFRRELGRSGAVAGYFHPYDIDTAQERFMHPALGGSRLLNALMYVNRRRVLPRIEEILDDGARIVPYADFVGAHLPPAA